MGHQRRFILQRIRSEVNFERAKTSKIDFCLKKRLEIRSPRVGADAAWRLCVFPSPRPPGWAYWSVLREFGYQGSLGYGLISTSACIHPRREETVDTFLEVAGTGNRTRDFSLDMAMHACARSADCAKHSAIPSQKS